MNKITVPVFLAGAWQDEEVGGYFPTMLDNFTGTDKLHFTLVNGGHIDSADPPILTRWLEFLSFYVRREIPHLPADRLDPIFGGLALEFFDVPHVVMEPDRFTGFPSFDAALASFESEPKVRVLFDSGAIKPCPGFPKQNCLGGPQPAFEHSYTQWPVDGLQPAFWYFQDGGRLDPSPPTGDGADSYIYDTSRAQLTSCHNCGDGCLAGKSPLGLAAVARRQSGGLCDRSAHRHARDGGLRERRSVAEVDGDRYRPASDAQRDSPRRPGDVRANRLAARQLPQDRRAGIDACCVRSTTAMREILRRLPADEFVLARVELYPFGHVFRAGSRIRISVEAPGGDRPEWKFDALPADGQVINTIGHSAAYPSRLVLPVVPDPGITAPLPPCPSLRGQPCRTYVEVSNTPG